MASSQENIMTWNSPDIEPQCGAVITLPIFSKFLTIDTHSLPIRARNGVSVVITNSDFSSASVTRVLYAISCCMGPHHNSTWLLFCWIWFAWIWVLSWHYNDVIISAVASQITSVSIVCLTVWFRPSSIKHQSYASLAFYGEFTGDQWIPLTKSQ